MKAAHWLMLAAASAFLVGCSGGAPEEQHAQKKDKKAVSEPAAQQDGDEIVAALAKLDAQDRQLAEERKKFCAVRNDNRLGSMGTPVKVIVKRQPVFLCCKNCQKTALADPEKTLAKVNELKVKAAGSLEK